MSGIQDISECPNPPRRLVTDRIYLKKAEENAAWESRKANKMRVRFPVTASPPPAPHPALIASMQPAITLPLFNEKTF